jgi:mannosyltransferase
MPAASWTDWIKSHRIALLLGLVMLLGIFLRFYDLGAESLWLDEAESIRESGMTVQGAIANSNQPPFYTLLLRGWIHLFGTSEFAVRSLSAIFGVLAVWLVFLAGRALFNSRTGLIAAFLVSFASYPISHSQDARAYSLLLLLSVFSYWSFIGIIKSGKNWLYPVYFLAGVLLAYTHFYGLFILLAQAILFLIFFRRFEAQRWKYPLTFVALLVALIPFALLMKGKISSIASHGFWLPRPDLSTLWYSLVAFTGTGSARYVIVVLFLLLAVFGFWTYRQIERKSTTTRKSGNPQPVKTEWKFQAEPARTSVLLLLWLLVPLLVPFIESQVMTPIYQTKYAIGSLPALFLLAAGGLNNFRWRWVFYPLLALIVVLSSIGLRDYYRFDIKEQWREVAQLIRSESGPGDAIILCEGYYASPFNYYYHGQLRETGIFNVEDAQKFVSTATAEIARKQGKVWLVLAYGKPAIRDYFVKTYGESSVDLARGFQAITVFRFKVNSPAK